MLKDWMSKPIVVAGAILLLLCAVFFGNSIMYRTQMLALRKSDAHISAQSGMKPFSDYNRGKEIGHTEHLPYRYTESLEKADVYQQELKMSAAVKERKIASGSQDKVLQSLGDKGEITNSVQSQLREIVAEKNNIEVEIKKLRETEEKRNTSTNNLPYNINFKGVYVVKNPFRKSESTVDFNFPLPQSSGTVSNVEILVGGKEPEDVQYTTSSIDWSVKFKPAEQKSFLVSYKTTGNNNFLYKVVHGNRIKEFNLKMKVNAIDKVDIPEMSIPATKTEQKGGRWELEWNLVKMITVNDIMVQFARSLDVINQKVQILQLSKYIPLFLVIFFIYLVGAGMAERVKIDIEQYFLLSLTFFLFYPLLGYLSGLLDIKVAIALSGALMSLVILNHLRRVTSISFALSSVGLFLLIAFFIVPFGILYSDYTGIVFVVCVLVVIENLTRLSQKAKLNGQHAQEIQPAT